MLNKTFLKKTKEKLKQEREDLSSRTVYKHDIDIDGDETDEIQANVLIEMQNQLHSRDQLKLAQIFDALKKIEKNEYGLCQDCGEDIPEKRLSINPYFLTCISCAEDREVEERQKKRF